MDDTLTARAADDVESFDRSVAFVVLAAPAAPSRVGEMRAPICTRWARCAGGPGDGFLP